mmetsp:Transcript_1463/g.1622  ORF Transcript_1463/g.1622 Transcript_1463/m.1622 type:complete len:118 (+) Transcript_1463:1219-1572(+)
MEKVTIIQVRGSNKFNLMIGTWLCPDHRQVHWDNELKLATSASTASTNHDDDNKEEDSNVKPPPPIKISSTSNNEIIDLLDDDEYNRPPSTRKTTFKAHWKGIEHTNNAHNSHGHVR